MPDPRWPQVQILRFPHGATVIVAAGIWALGTTTGDQVDPTGFSDGRL